MANAKVFKDSFRGYKKEDVNSYIASMAEGMKKTVEEAEVQPAVPEVESVSVDVEPVPVPVVEPEPIKIAPIVEPQPVPVSKIIEQAIAEPAVPEPTVLTAKIESPFLPVAEEEPKPVILTEEEIMARKPVYGVSQNEKMFVADENYETDIPAVAAKEENLLLEDTYSAAGDTQIVRPETVVVNNVLPDAKNQIVTQEVFEETEVVDTCADGVAPDMDGCCSGEELRAVDGNFMCCVIGTDECFEPMI